MGEELTQRDINVETAIAKLAEQIKAAFKRIDEQTKLTEAVSDLAASVKVLASEQKRMSEEQARQRLDIDALRMQPAKRWEAVVGQVLGLLVAGAAGGALLKMFGG